jgi:hypothetical protein
VRDSRTAAWKRRAPKKVARRPDYYAVTQVDGTKNQVLEDSLARLESYIAPLLSHLREKTVWTEEDAAALVVFAAPMYARLPFVHDHLDRTFAKPHLQRTLSDRYRKLLEDPEAFRQSLEACAKVTGNSRVLQIRAEDIVRLIPHAEVNREFLISRVFQATVRHCSTYSPGCVGAC